MPTGYTAVLHERDIDLSDFAMQAARAMGAMIHMRDDGMNAPYRPDVPSVYYVEGLAKAQGDLAKYKSMTIEDAKIEYDRDRQERYERAIKRIAECQVVKGRYDQMTAKVKAWTPPTPEHEGFKSFMLDQLSICESDYNTKYYEDDAKPVTPCTEDEAAAWLQQRIVGATERVAYMTKQGNEDRERVNKRNEWVRQLQESLSKGGTAGWGAF